MQDINSVLFPVSASEKHPNTKEIIKIAESMGITQTEIAELIGCSQPYVTQLKQGKGLAKIADLEPLIFRISPKLPGEEFFQYTVFKHKTYTLPENWEKRVIVHAYIRHDQTKRYPSYIDDDDDYSHYYDQEFDKIRDKHLSYLKKNTDHIKNEVNAVDSLKNDLSSILEAYRKKESVNNDENINQINKVRLLESYKMLMIKYLRSQRLPFIELNSISDDSFLNNLPNIDEIIEETLSNLDKHKKNLNNKITDIERGNSEKVEKLKICNLYDKKAFDEFISTEITDPDREFNLTELSYELFSDNKFEINNDYQNISFDMASEFLKWANVKGNISTNIATELIQICGKSLWLYNDKYEARIEGRYSYDYTGHNIYIRLIETNSNRLYIVEKDSGISNYTIINGPYSSLEILNIIRNKYFQKFDIDIDEIEKILVREGYPLPGIRYIY